MMEKAIAYLKEKGIEAFDGGDGILVIPVSSAEEIYDMANNVRRYFKECGYEKSWRIDPYYYQKRMSLSGAMFDDFDSQKLHAI